MQKRSEDSPRGIQFIITDKVGVVALQSIKDESLVRLWDLQVAETSSVCEVELSDGSLHAQSWQLAVHLDVYTLVWLDTDDELVSWDILEDSAGDVLELNADLGLLLVQSLTSLENEGNTIPAFVLDVDDEGAESWASAVCWDCVVVEIAWL